MGRGAVDINDTSLLDLLVEGLDGISAKPLTGYGSYSSYDMPFKPHNMIVAAWLDSGILGFLLLTLGIFFLTQSVLARDRDLLIACVPLVLLLPFSHNLLDNKSYLMVWVLTCGLVAHKIPARRVLGKVARSRQVLRPQVPALATAR